MTAPTAADDEKQPTQDVPTDAAAGSAMSTEETTDAAPAPDDSVEALNDPEFPTSPPAPVPAPVAPATTPAAGQHAAPRPYPPVPPTSARGVTAETDSLLPPMTTGTPTAPSSAPAPAPAPIVAGPAVTDDPAVPDLPRRPGAKRHLIGMLLGLLVTPVGLVLAAMGVGHMVDLPAGDGALTDPLGLVQLVLGALVLGAVAYLGRWSPAVPITGGVLWGLGGGGLALWDPAGVSEAVHEVTDGRFAQVATDHILQPAQTGSLLVVGVVLLTAGIAAGRARRSGRLFGVGTTLTQAARAEAERLEAARQ